METAEEIVGKITDALIEQGYRQLGLHNDFMRVAVYEGLEYKEALFATFTNNSKPGSVYSLSLYTFDDDPRKTYVSSEKNNETPDFPAFVSASAFLTAIKHGIPVNTLVDNMRPDPEAYKRRFGTTAQLRN